jgi:hypothetical protein
MLCPIVTSDYEIYAFSRGEMEILEKRSILRGQEFRKQKGRVSEPQRTEFRNLQPNSLQLKAYLYRT